MRLAAAAVALAILATSGASAAFDPARSPHEYVTRVFQTSDGLPVGVIMDALQSRDGYLWLATEEGLVRFDGARFVLFNRNNTPALQTNYARALAEDASGTLYVGTFGGGLVRFKDGAFTVVATESDLGSDEIRHVAVDATGAAWINTDDGGLSRLADGRVTRVDTPDHKARDITSDGEGGVWVARDGLGLTHYARDARDAPRTYTTRDGLTTDALASVFRDRAGNVWAGSRSGVLHRFRDFGFTSYAPDDAATAAIVDITEDHEGNVWLATQDGGAKRFRDGQFTTFGKAEGLPVGKTYTVLEDREHNVWVGTMKGLVRMKRGAFTTYDDAKPGEAAPFVWCVREDDHYGLWLTTQSDGLQKHTAGPVRSWRKRDGLSSDEVSVLEQDRRGNVWVGSRAGLNRLSPDGKIKVLTTRDGLPDDRTYGLFVDRRDTLWIGTYGGGLARLEGDRAVALSRGGAGAGDPVIAHVTSIVEDTTGRLWVGGEEGLARVVEGALTPVRLDVDDSVLALHADADGTLWIGFENAGLGRLREGKLVNVTTRDGLASDTIYAILDDGRGYLWTSSNTGVARVAKADIEALASRTATRVGAVAYGKEDGMRSPECNGGSTESAWRSRDGRLWFATTEGVVAVDPARLPKNGVPPPVVIEEILVNREPKQVAAPLRLPPGSREFELRYAAMSFTTPERVVFKYMLEGFDGEWVAAGGRRVAYYTNLAPGDYRFRVIAANEDGVWNETGASLAFYVTPHFYETRGFYVAVALGAIVSAVSAFRLRVRQLRLRAEQLEESVRQRTAELSLAYADLAEKDRRLAEDLAQARAFQQSLLPELPQSDVLRFAAAYQPAEMVGGDIYDVSAIDAGLYRVFLADTTGHGVQASLRTMVLRTEYDRRKASEPSPGALLSSLNRALVTSFPDLEMRCSAVCFDVRVDEGGGVTLTYANAAHPALLHVRAGEVAEVYERSSFLGVIDDVEIAERVVRLAPGDLLLAYTDGVTEQESAAGVAFGTARLGELATTRRGADDVIHFVTANLVELAGPSGLADDATLIALECLRA